MNAPNERARPASGAFNRQRAQRNRKRWFPQRCQDAVDTEADLLQQRLKVPETTHLLFSRKPLHPVWLAGCQIR
jgi:hypothetical protein